MGEIEQFIDFPQLGQLIRPSDGKQIKHCEPRDLTEMIAW